MDTTDQKIIFDWGYLDDPHPEEFAYFGSWMAVRRGVNYKFFRLTTDALSGACWLVASPTPDCEKRPYIVTYGMDDLTTALLSTLTWGTTATSAICALAARKDDESD